MDPGRSLPVLSIEAHRTRPPDTPLVDTDPPADPSTRSTCRRACLSGGTMSVPSSRSGSPAPLGGSQFVGRAAELARLDAALVAAGGGSPSTFLIGGEAGVGKTRLLREVTERSTAAGARVLCGSCVELGTGDIPFAPLVDALRGLAREIGPDTVRELGGSAAAALTRLAPFLGDQPEPEPLGRHT